MGLGSKIILVNINLYLKKYTILSLMVICLIII